MAGAKLIFSFHGSPKENSERCLTCHITSQQQEMFAHSQHAAAGVSCNECHAAHLVEEVKDQSKGSLPYAQAAFFQVPQLPETVRWLHNSLLKESEPNSVLYLPWQHPGAVRPAGAPPGAGGTDEVYGLS